VDKKASNRYLGVIVGLCFAIYFITNYPMYQLSPIADAFKSTFGLDNTQYTSIFSAPMIPGVLLSIVAGLIIDKIGPRRAVLFGMIITTVGMAARIGADSYWSFLVCMISLGIGATAMNVSGPKILVGWAKPEKLGSLVGVIYAGATFSMAVGMGTTAFFPSISSAFIFATILCVILTIAWIILMKDGPAGNIRRGHGRKGHDGDSSSAAIEDIRPSADAAAESVSIGQCLKEVVKSPAVWIIGICLFGVMGGNVGLSAYLPSALSNVRGFSATDAGLISAFIMIGTLVGNITGPFIDEKIGHTKAYLIVASVLCAVLIASAWLLPEGPILMCALFITGFALGSLTPVLIALPVRSGCVEPRYVGTAQGVCSTLMTLGAIVIPTYIIAPIAGTDFTLMMTMAGASVLIATVALVFLRFKGSASS